MNGGNNATDFDYDNDFSDMLYCEPRGRTVANRQQRETRGMAKYMYRHH